jgi:hypothetical protein
MKIHAFKAEQLGLTSLDELILRIEQLQLDDRLRSISGYNMRLEDTRRTGRFILMDFVGIRHDGPGRASATGPIQDFDLEDHEGFGHETAVCYHIDNKILTMQYNHFGPRISKLQSYLYTFLNGTPSADENGTLPINESGIYFLPILRSDASDRLNNMTIVKNIEISLFVPGAIGSVGQSSPSLNGLLSNPLVGSSDKFKFRLSVGKEKGRSLSLDAVKNTITELLGLRDDVTSIQVTGMDSEESPQEPIDLLEARLEADPPVIRTGRRYGRAERWDALMSTFNIWHGNGQLS